MVSGTTYRGFKYIPWTDVYIDATGRPENKKIWHDIAYPDGRTLPGPWGPYTNPTEKQFNEHIDWMLSHSQRETA